METRSEPISDRRTAADPAETGTLLRRRDEWVLRWEDLRESVDSEWSAAFQALTSPGTEPIRKWLGWVLYRLAARVNPEIRD
jgi:hypothetical protein